MSLITQCPACTTLFKVVPDQLRISDGWVRCGQCDEVFDANAHLQAAEPVLVRPAAPEPEAPPSPSQDAVAPIQGMGVVLPDAAEPTSVPDDAPVEEPLAEAVDASVEPPPQVIKSDWTDEETPLPTEEEMHAWVLAAVASEASDLKAQSSALMDAMPRYIEVQAPTPESQHGGDVASDVAQALTGSPQADVASELGASLPVGEPRLSFMKPVAGPSVWSRSPVRAILFALCVVLGVALILQMLVHQRDWLAAKAPATRPMVVEMCVLMGCQVSPLREIEAVVIDSSAFVKIRPNVYRVHFTLKNTAVYAVGTPSLELTLTNTGDQAIVRRIFSPQEFGIQQASMAPSAEMNAVVSIGVKLADDAERVSGYRLLVFYP
jgi:predicted Zn finger-like uncharacterized protein